MYCCEELFMHLLKCYFGVCFMSCKATQETNTKVHSREHINSSPLQPQHYSQYIQSTVVLIKFLPSLPVTAERGSAPSAHYPPKRATSGIGTCSVVGDTSRPVAKLSPALGWTLPCLACLWARIRARPAKQSTGWRNTVTNVWALENILLRIRSKFESSTMFHNNWHGI